MDKDPRYKDMLKKCSDCDNALSYARAANGVDADDNLLPDPARDVTPSGTPGCKIVGTPGRSSPGTSHNNQADRTTARPNPHLDGLGADPRAAALRQLALSAAHAGVADNAGAAHADTLALVRCSGTGGWPSPDASVWQPQHIRCCSNDFVDETV